MEGAGGTGDNLTAGAQELAALEQVKTIRHPFLLSIERIEIIQDTLLIVMELADRNLQAVLLEHQVKGQVGIPRQQLVGFLFEAAEALDELNFRHGLQHLDVKPHNLIRSTDGTVKVLDFGLARVFQEAAESSGSLTSAGVVMGTADYIAPEQARDPCLVDIRADVYSLGCTLYHAAAGEVPFADDNLVRQILRHANQAPRPLREIDRSIPKEFEQIVGRLLEKDPYRRYQTPTEAGKALRDYLATAN